MAAACLLVFVGAQRASAQQLEPRAYSPSPTGMNFAVVSYVFQTGDVIFDASLPFSNVSANINVTAFGYVRTFSLFGRSASAAIVVPYAFGHVQGDVGEVFHEIHRSGLADMPMRVSVNLIGGPAETPQEFATRKPATTLGFSFFVVAPTGQYLPDKLINIGANRWAFKTELGFSHPVGHWVFDAYGGVWFFTTNDDFYVGRTRQQNPIGVVQAHVSYNFRPGLWVAADYTYYWGGQTTTSGTLDANRLDNSRIGVTAAIPLSRNQSIKLAWARGATTRIGADFTTYSIGYQFRWLDKK